MVKKKVLFVGSFKELGGNGNVGGQMFACKSLLNSSLSEQIDWVLIDTTADSNIYTPIFLRIFKAIKRFSKFMFYLIFKNINSTLIFTSNGSSFLEKGTMSLMAKLFGLKVIIAPRSGFIKEDIDKGGFMKSFIKFIFSKADFVICQGETWKSYFYEKRLTSEEKLIVIKNWIDTSIYDFYKIENNNVNILFLGWVDKNKGIFDLVDALKVLHDENLNFILNIAGDGSAMDEIKFKIEQMGLNDNVILHGWMLGDEKMSLLKSADIFVLPSYFEGFPNALLEAMASGTACISTEVGSVSELIKNNENGLLIQPGNIHQLANALKLLIANPTIRNRFGSMAKESVRQNNAVETAVKKISKLLN